MDAYIGEVRLFPYNFPPLGWAYCDGQLLPMAQFQALGSILWHTYGNGGSSSFYLPDLRNRAVVGDGSGPGLTPYTIGQTFGTTTVTITESEMPRHNHQMNARSTLADKTSPLDNVFAASNAPVGPQRPAVSLYTETPPQSTLRPDALTTVGGGQPHTNMQPFLGLSFCICLDGGDYPHRP